jgi:DnaK suppressor protein
LVHLTTEQVAYLKELLLKQENELISTAEETLEEMESKDENIPDPTDRASFETDIGVELKIRDRERKLIKKVRSALKRIEDGTYGLCDKCPEEISFKRLEARPVTSLCIKCKEREEREERLRGE